MNKYIPRYLYKKSNIVFQVLFTAVFALIFINLYQPFDSKGWDVVQGLSDFEYFFYSSLLILVGVAVVAVGNTSMYYYSKKNEVTYVMYVMLILTEIVSMSLVYTSMAYIFGDSRGFYNIFKSSAINTSLVLFLPYTISILYFSLSEKNRLLKDAQDNEVVDPEIPVGIIPFHDIKGEMRISIQKDYLMYVESADNYVYIYYMDKGKLSKFLIRNTMKYYEEYLEKYNILRVHRSYIVNMDQVKVLKRNTDGICLDFGIDGVTEIPCSKKYNQAVITYFTI